MHTQQSETNSTSKFSSWHVKSLKMYAAKTCKYTHTERERYILIHTSAHAHIYEHMYTFHMNAYTHTQIYTHTHIHAYTHIQALREGL